MTDIKKPVGRERGKVKYGKLDIAIFVVSILISASLLILAGCFIASVCNIYFGAAPGTLPYSRETVAEHFKRILPAVIPTVILVITGGVLSVIRNKEKIVGREVSPRLTVRALRRSIARYEVSSEFADKITRERRIRFIYGAVTAFLVILFFALSAIFVCNPARYSLTDINTDIAYSVLLVGESAVGAFGVLLLSGYLFTQSYEIECRITKAELLRLAGSPKIELREPKRQDLIINIVRAVIIVTAIVFIILGITNGGMADVLGKAVRICTECIGLG